MEKKESKLLPLLSLIFGIASLLTSCILIVSLLCAVTSIVLAIISFVKKKPVPMPIVGLICSFFGIITTIIIALIGTTLGIALGENSIINNAKEASEATQSIIDAEKELQEYSNEILNEYLTPETNVLSNETIETNTVNNNTTTDISNDWKDAEFIFDGKNFKLFDKYSELESIGWSFGKNNSMYDEYTVLNSQEKTYSTISLEKDTYDSTIYIGVANTDSVSSTIKNGTIWSFKVDNSFANTQVPFELAKGIKNGSTLEEVKAAYGEPEYTYYSSYLNYWSYTYGSEMKPQLTLIIYEDDAKGLTEFEYSYY